MFVMKCVILLFVLIRCVICDVYLAEIQTKCIINRRPYFCAKYRFLKFIDNISNGDSYLWSNSTSEVKIMKMYSSEFSQELSLPRQNSNDSEHTKLIKFLKRKLVLFVNTHGVAFRMPQGSHIIENRALKDYNKEESRKRKKKFLLFPIIILVKLLKIKMMLSIIMFGVLVVKKIIFLAALVYPAIIVSVKNACKRDEDRYYGPDPHDRGYFG